MFKFYKIANKMNLHLFNNNNFIKNEHIYYATKKISSTNLFYELLEIYTPEEIASKLFIHKGTLKRWLEQKKKYQKIILMI